MPKYKTALTAFGLDCGDTFESEDPRWEDHVKAGNVTRVDTATPLTVVETAPVKVIKVKVKTTVSRPDPALVALFGDADGQ